MGEEHLPLTRAERRTLAELLAAIVPVDSDADAYVVRRLAGPDADELPQLRAALATAAEDEPAYVARLAAAPAETAEAQLFRRLRAWAWEGLLCDPSYGGNRDGIGWAQFGYEGHPKAEP